VTPAWGTAALGRALRVLLSRREPPHRWLPSDRRWGAQAWPGSDAGAGGILLTWDCRHLANANKFEHIRRVNTLLGLAVPALVTPLELMGEGEMP